MSSELLEIKKPDDYEWMTDKLTEVPLRAKRHPRPYRLRLIAEQFRKFAKVETNVVDFSEGVVPSVRMTRKKVSSCKTIACHGGWIMPALYNIGIKEVRGIMDKGVNPGGYLCDVDYVDGSDRISEYLFDGVGIDFSEWAGRNPLLWGGSRGRCMFASYGYKAFVLGWCLPDVVDLNVIADRYDDVAYRVEQVFYV